MRTNKFVEQDMTKPDVENTRGLKLAHRGCYIKKNKAGFQLQKKILLVMSLVGLGAKTN
jgi:hypothetical protein